MWSWLTNLFASPAPRLTLEKKLAILARGGFRIAESFKIADVIPEDERADLEKPGFDLLLCQLGGEEGCPSTTSRITSISKPAKRGWSSRFAGMRNA